MDQISGYFPRELSYASNNLRAIEDISEAFDGEGMGDVRARRFYGIPLQYNIDDWWGEGFLVAGALAWRVEAYVCHGSAGIEDWEMFQGANIPSWTWASRKSAK